MQSKITHTEASQNRRSISRNLFPLRNNSIRGASLNHSGIVNQYNKSANMQSTTTQTNDKYVFKTLTVLLS